MGSDICKIFRISLVFTLIKELKFIAVKSLVYDKDPYSASRFALSVSFKSMESIEDSVISGVGIKNKIK